MHIGISGPIGSGKSTLAKELQQLAREHNFAAEIIPFASGVRELAAYEGSKWVTMSIMQKLWDWGIPTTQAAAAAGMIAGFMERYPTQPGVKNRRLLQIIGTEVGREYLDKDIWVKRTKQLFRQFDPLDFVFSDDVRFDNEALAVDVHIGITITGNEALYEKRTRELGYEYTYSDHTSERSLSSPPLFTVPIGFTQKDVYSIYDKLDYIRRLR
jgi:hypothetical protein